MKKLLIASILALTAGVSQAATIQYVGSWHVGDGPRWTTNPLAYSGVSAAQMLFGPGTYEISTAGTDPNAINHTAHYAVIGIGFQDFADNYFRGTVGVTHYEDYYHFDPALDTVSTYVNDFGAGGINYAFRVVNNVPEPASVALLGVGLLGAMVSRRKSAKK